MKRVLIGLLVTVVLAHQLLPASMGGAAVVDAAVPIIGPRSGPTVPVLLVHGMLGAVETWSLPPQSGGLFQHLRIQGYRPGRELFWSEAPAWRDPVAAADSELVPLLVNIREITGSPVVDVVVHGSGALLVQALLRGIERNPQLGQRLPHIRQVIALAPLFAGHEGADAVRSAAFRSGLIEWHRRQQLGRNIGQVTGADLNQTDPATLITDERAYVVRRAYETYEPFYHRYLREAWFMPDPEEVGRPSPTFWDWLQVRYPDESKSLLVTEPPLGRSAGPPHWPVGTDLSRAYYERTAFEAARFAYHSLAPVGDVLKDRWQQDLRDGMTDNLWGTLWRFLARRAEHVVRTYGPWWLQRGADAFTEQLFRNATGVEPLSTPVRRLVNLDDNVWLQAVQPDGGHGARPHGPRWVVIDGDLVGPAAWLLPPTTAQPAPVDGVFAPDLDDEKIVVRGWWGVDAAGLPRHKSALAAVTAALRWYEPAGPLAVGDQAQSWRLSEGVQYRRLPGTGAQAYTVTVSASHPGSGAMEAVVWAIDPATGVRLDSTVVKPGNVAGFTLPGNTVIGARPVGPGGRTGNPAGQLAVHVRPASPAGGWRRSPRDAVTSALAGAVDRASPPGVQHDDLAAFDENLPLIRVILHSRRTTAWEERRERHERWLWSFGDGTTLIDDDPDHLTSRVNHLFSAPGVYTVSATSYSNYGRELRRQAWDIVVAEGDAPTVRQFTAVSIAEPDVSLQLHGPQEWIVGRPATFDVRADIVAPEFGEIVEQRIDPGTRFGVLWERPGHDFVVRAALLVKVRYTFPDGGRLTVQNVYVVDRSVDVLAIGSPGWSSIPGLSRIGAMVEGRSS